MKPCPVCGKEFKNLGVHMRAHKGEDNGLQEERQIPKWRLRTPVFTDGQAGLKVPQARMKKGVKHVGS